MAKNINEKPFDDATKLKLEIFRECFREWLPVFIHNNQIDRIYIYDFFAGSGTDSEGCLGSPLILLEEARGKDCANCLNSKGKKVVFGFNEKLEGKNDELRRAVGEFVETCKSDFCKNEKCLYEHYYAQFDFKDAFEGKNFKSILSNEKYAKFIILDQYGYKHVDENIFKQFVSAPKTDFIFFIASSFITRFKEHENTKRYIDTSKIDFDGMKPKERHKLIAQYYKSLINNPDYYIHHFTIKKNSNHYGLIFGSSHSPGMEKFLKVCWKKDEKAGESNDNAYNDETQDSLFFIPETSNKKEDVKQKIRTKILNGEIRTNKEGFRFTMSELCLPIIFTEVVKDLEKQDLIKRTGDLNYSSTNIHSCKEYKIERKGRK